MQRVRAGMFTALLGSNTDTADTVTSFNTSRDVTWSLSVTLTMNSTGDSSITSLCDVTVTSTVFWYDLTMERGELL